MVVIALIALVQLAVLVMILAVVTDPGHQGGGAAAVKPTEQIHRLQDLTIESMLAESARAEQDDGGDWEGHYYHPGS